VRFIFGFFFLGGLGAGGWILFLVGRMHGSQRLNAAWPLENDRTNMRKHEKRTGNPDVVDSSRYPAFQND